eukprot:COSAG02_NODE_6794_length_3358_cov_13.133783_4_plen_221_part_00
MIVPQRISPPLTSLLRLQRLSCHLIRTAASATAQSSNELPPPPPNWRLTSPSPNADSYTHGANQSPPFPCGADSDFAKLDPAESAPSDAYKLIISAVTPRPICFISTIGDDGTCNLSVRAAPSCCRETPDRLRVVVCSRTHSSTHSRSTHRPSASAPWPGHTCLVVTRTPCATFARQAAVWCILFLSGSLRQLTTRVVRTTTTWKSTKSLDSRHCPRECS